MIDYQIVVPSKGRPGNMAGIMDLLPTAAICVDEREEAAYRDVVPKQKLVLHEPTKTLGQVRQWVLDHWEQECVVMIDDDFRQVVCNVGRRTRRITDPDAIRQVIENAATVSKELDIALFHWSRQPNPRDFKACDPISFKALASNAWGVVGREFKVDTSLNLCESVDLTLQNLLKRRIVFQDRRFYFDCGGVWSGRGGLQSMRTMEGQNDEKRKMAQRWGRYLGLDKKKRRGTTGMSLNVTRRQGL